MAYCVLVVLTSHKYTSFVIVPIVSIFSQYSGNPFVAIRSSTGHENLAVLSGITEKDQIASKQLECPYKQGKTIKDYAYRLGFEDLVIPLINMGGPH